MRTTLDLPDPLFRTLKSRAALDGITLKELVVRYLQRGLSQPEPLPGPATAGHRAPFPVLIPSNGQKLGLPPELLSNAGMQALLDAEDDEKVLRHLQPAKTANP